MKEKLIIEVEKMSGRPCRVAGDFVRLSRSIEERTGERLSASTLRRLWGYDKADVQPRRYTLDVLARFLGFREYAGFEKVVGCGEPQSGFVIDEKLSAADLSLGERLRLTWLPDRECEVEHLGDGHFVVVRSVNTRICAGDTFECPLFIVHEPLYLDNLIHAGSSPSVYVIGKKDGVTVERISGR